VHQLIEDPVDELRGLRGAEAFGKFDSLVDRHAIGCIGVEDFVGAEPDHVAVGGRDPLQAPVGGRLFDQGIYFLRVPTYPGNQPLGELYEVIRTQPAADPRIGFDRITRRIQIVPVQKLEGDLSCLAASNHGKLMNQKIVCGSPPERSPGAFS